MTDRSVKVTLVAEVTGYIARMQQAGIATRSMATDAAMAAAASRQMSENIGRAAAITGGAMLAGVGLATKAFADFDKAMSGVRAATRETAGNMQLLRQAALQAGADTAFSATEAAEGITELAKAGVSTKAVLGGGLRGALDLAAAGQISVAEAAETAASAMTQFRLQGAQVPHIADLLAAGAGKAQGSVGDMGAALKQSGLVASQFGLSIEETVGSLAAFASAGLVGSDAGTSFRSMLLHLANPAEETKRLMAELGISAYDAQGQFVGIAGLAQQLTGALGDLAPAQRDAALAQIFGSDAIRAANVLYAQGADGIDRWISKVNDQGYAAETAAIQMDNLRGDLEKLTGSLETAFGGAGGGANSALREITQGATGAVNAFSDLPSPVQQTATGIAAVGGSALLAIGAFGTLAPKVRETRDYLNEMGRAGQFADRSLGVLGRVGGYAIAITTIGTALGYLGDKITELQGDAAPQVGALTRALVTFADTGRLTGAAVQGLGDNVSKLAEDLDTVTGIDAKIHGFASSTSLGIIGSRVDEARDRVNALDEALTSLVQQGYGDKARAIFDAITASLPEDKVRRLRSELDGYANAQANAATQSYLAASSATELGSALGDQVAPAAQEAAQATERFVNALDDMRAVDAYTSAAELRIAFRDLKNELADGGRVTDEEKVALGGFARQVRQAASAVFEHTGSQERANAAMRAGRRQFLEAATAAGYTAREARELARELLDIPARTDVTIQERGADEALAKIVELRRQAGVPISVTVNTINRLRNVPGNAAGGYITGPGSGTSDSIPAWLSNGEYVMKAAAVAKYGTHTFDRLNAMAYAAGGLVRPQRGDYGSRDAYGRALDQYRERRENRWEYRLERMSPEEQVAELSRRIRGEKKYTDEWKSLVDRRKAVREQIRADERRAAEEAAREDERIREEQRRRDEEDQRRRQQYMEEAARLYTEQVRAAEEALEAAVRARDEYARTVSGSITGFGSLASSASLEAVGAGQLTAAQAGGRHLLSGQSIAAGMAARLAAARNWVTDMRALRAAGLNAGSLQEILAMGPGAGSAYARALLESGLIGVVNANQAELSALGSSFGMEASNWFHQAGISAAQSALSAARAPQWFSVPGGGSNVRVFIGDRELTDLVSVEVDGQLTTMGNSLAYGRTGW